MITFSLTNLFICDTNMKCPTQSQSLPVSSNRRQSPESKSESESESKNNRRQSPECKSESESESESDSNQRQSPE